MPVRSSSLSVLVRLDRRQVEVTLGGWAVELARDRDELVAVGYFRSYARGTSAVGSDLDVVVLVWRTANPWMCRLSSWGTVSLAVPVDLLEPER